MANVARSVVDVVLGEAVSGTPQQRYQDMLNIASVISNRAKALGVTPEQVVGTQQQFNSFNKTLPPGVENYRTLAQKAVNEVAIKGPLTPATFYSTPETAKNLPSGLVAVTDTTGHTYFVDPKNRAIGTAIGYKTPDPSALGPLPPAKDALSAISRAMGVSAPPIGMPETTSPASSYASTSAPTSQDDVMAERAAVAKNLADVTYSMGPNRPNKPHPDVVDTIRSAVADALGPGYGVTVTSGTEDPGKQYGSNRHKTGTAADVSIVDLSTGRVLNTFQDKQALVDVAQAAAAKGIKGIGIGTDYMGGVAMHLDKFTPGVGQANQWGNIGKANASLFDEARAFKEMPASFYSKSLPASMPAPPSKPSASPSSLTAAPIGQVQRASLPAIDSQKMTAVGGPVSPARPDNLDYAGPVGKFSVPSTPAVAPSNAYATTNLPSVSPAPAKTAVPTSAISGMLSPMATAAAQTFMPQATALMPAKPSVAPVPAAAVPKPTVVAAPPVPSYSPSKAVAPARPSLSPADVYGGAVGTAQTSTPGTTVSRATSYGPSYVTNQFGVTTATAPDGTQMAAWGGVPSAKPAISGPLSNTGIATPPSTGVGGMFGPKAKAATGTIAGAAIGGYALGPLGAMLGGLIGKNIAAGKAPLSGIFGGNNANTHVVDTFDGPMSFANAKGGLGFPSAPANPGGYTATSSNNSAAGMRSISPGAAAAIGAGQGGLY